MDFDDLIFRTVELFQKDAEVLEQYQDRFRFIMVDEYQDTNYCAVYAGKTADGQDAVTFVWWVMMTSPFTGWRGADIRNILDFEEVYPDAKVIKLEQNYRSTAEYSGCGQRK